MVWKYKIKWNFEILLCFVSWTDLLKIEQGKTCQKFNLRFKEMNDLINEGNTNTVLINIS